MGIHIGGVKLRETNPNKFEKPGRGKVSPGQILFGYTRLRGTRHIFGEALKAGGNKSYTNVGALKLREMNPNKFLRKPGRGKLKP